MPDIYTYNDFRKFIRDYYEETKKHSPSFSFQNFAQKAGISSSGFLLHVMKGERNLTRTVILKVAKAMRLSPDQTDYFENLVLFGQAKTQQEKDRYYAKILASRQALNIKTIDDSRYRFYSDWYHAVVREIAGMIDTGISPSELANSLVPPISTKEAKRSLQLLQELGILRKTASGTYEQTEQFFSGGSSEIRNMAIVNFQKAMIHAAANAWEHFKEKEIDMNTVTFSVSENGAAKIREEIASFKTRLFNILEMDYEPASRAYNMNLHLFPVSKAIKERRI